MQASSLFEVCPTEALKVGSMRTTFAYWVRGREFAELAAMSIASVKRLEPYQATRRIVVITDSFATHAECQGLFDKDVAFIQHDLTGRPAMVANLDAQITCLLATPLGQRVLFLDADTIMLQAFPWTDADLHVTWRDQVNGDGEMAKQQPWNAGVIGVNVTPASIEAFYWLRARVLRMSQDRQAWYGNQLALADLLGQPNGTHERRIRWTMEDEGTPLSVCELPCDTWNYSPNSADEEVNGKGILHMKGDRKDLMQHFAKAAA